MKVNAGIIATMFFSSEISGAAEGSTVIFFPDTGGDKTVLFPDGDGDSKVIVFPKND